MKLLDKELKPVPDSRIGNKADVAEFFGIALPTLEVWMRRGCPYISKGAKGISWQFDMLEVARWKFSPDVSDGEFNPDNLQPRERKDWYESEKKKRELQIQDGELYVADEYDREFSKTMKKVAMMLETLPDRLERDCGIQRESLDPVIMVIDDLREEIHKEVMED